MKQGLALPERRGLTVRRKADYSPRPASKCSLETRLSTSRKTRAHVTPKTIVNVCFYAFVPYFGDPLFFFIFFAPSKRDNLRFLLPKSRDRASFRTGRTLEQKLHFTCNKEGNLKGNWITGKRIFFRDHTNAPGKSDSICCVSMHSFECHQFEG